MSRRLARSAATTLVLLAGLGAPAAAEAYTVTVHVHGAGMVDEITPRNLMNCTVGPNDKANSSVTDCVAGSPSGAYNAFDVVELQAVVPADHFTRGWRFSHWVDSSAGGGKVNCDPQEASGTHTGTNCKFQVFENLEVDLYFTDELANQNTTLGAGGPVSGGRTNATSASFTFDSTEPDSRYDCKLDRPGQPGTWVADCGSSADKSESYGNLTDNGQYTFSVRAKDPSGNVDASPASRTWTVDTVPPVTSITGTPGPNALTNSRSASLSASPNEAAVTVCTLDGQAVGCGLSRNDLGDGQHTFSAQSTDSAGNVGPTVSRTWTVDTVAPTAAIGGSPENGALTNDRTPDLTGTSSEGAPVCRLNGTVRACLLTESLGDGQYTFTVTATDAAGNAHTVTRTWTIDATPPVITFTSGPPEGGVTNDSTPAFAWSANETGSAFTCKLDQGPFVQCEPIPELADGEHSYEVLMTDAAGNQGTAKRTFRVDTIPADTTLLSGPAEGSTTAQQEATFEFASPDSTVTFECSLDGAPFAACTSPLKLTGLTNADHVFEVRARDAAGNVDATPVKRAWRINSLDRDGDGVNAPADCDDANAAIRPGAADTPGDGVDQDCAGGDTKVVVPPVDDDKDDDGVAAGLDCDDANPAVRPGARDVPRDGIDQDCVGGDAPFPVATAALGYHFKPAGKRTRILRLVLSKIAVGATVKVACKGRGCPVRTRTVKPSTGTVDVRKLLKRKPLRAGNVLTLTISQPGHVSRVISFKARRGKSPAGGVFRCLEPGATKLSACP